MTRRYGTPAWADTQAEADYYAEAIDTHHIERADQRHEAQADQATSRWDTPPRDDGPITAAFRKVFGGES